MTPQQALDVINREPAGGAHYYSAARDRFYNNYGDDWFSYYNDEWNYHATILRSTRESLVPMWKLLEIVTDFKVL